MGRWDAAEQMWARLHPMERDWDRTGYRPGNAECLLLAYLRYPRGQLTAADLDAAERLARAGKALRFLHRLRGRWLIDRREYGDAAASLREAVRMAREASVNDASAEALLARARAHPGDRDTALDVARRLSDARDRPVDLELADLWRTLDDRERSARHAHRAYRYAWADGEPYVRRHELARASALLRELGEEIPALPPYDPTQHPAESWERDVEAAIAELERSRPVSNWHTRDMHRGGVDTPPRGADPCRAEVEQA